MVPLPKVSSSHCLRVRRAAAEPLSLEFDVPRETVIVFSFIMGVTLP
jgi:hypothetical protein